MSNLNSSLIEQLNESFSYSTIELVEKQVSKDGTIKLLFSLHDNQKIETVLMKYKHGNSICVTTQVGCRIGCSFCASGLLGLERNLEPCEIVEQIMEMNKILATEDTRVTHMVVMGIGEPFDNYDNLIKFLEISNDGQGLAIGARHITVSTSGIVPKIYDFAD